MHFNLWLRNFAGNLASSDYSNHLRMKYIIGKLVSVCAEGECIVDVRSLKSVRIDSSSLSSDHAPNLKENASKHDMDDKNLFRPEYKINETKSLPHDDFIVGRDREIAMIRDMVLDNAQYVAVAASLQGREEAENIHMSQKEWIIQTLQNIDESKKTEEVLLREKKNTQQIVDVTVNSKEMRNKVEYTCLAHNTSVTNLRNPRVIPIVGASGVGKSALARFIFQDRSVQDHFDGQSAWVYVSDRISQDDIIKQIMFSFGPEHALPNLTAELKDVHTVLQSII
jgi:ABC-type glutathione transport system ATPase component